MATPVMVFGGDPPTRLCRPSCFDFAPSLDIVFDTFLIVWKKANKGYPLFFSSKSAFSQRHFIVQRRLIEGCRAEKDVLNDDFYCNKKYKS